MNLAGSKVRWHPLAVAICLAVTAMPTAAEEAGIAALRYEYRLQQRQQRTASAESDRARSGSTKQALSAPARAGITRAVTTCADDGSAGSLRSQMYGAAEGDTIDLSKLSCSTITLERGPIDIGILSEDVESPIYELTLKGPGRDALTIDGAGATRILLAGGYTSNKGKLTISDLTLANGLSTGGLAACIDTSTKLKLSRVTVRDCHASGGSPLTFAGAIDAGDTELVSSTISDSSSSAGGDAVAIGGGLYSNGNLRLVDSVISGNTVDAQTAGDGFGYVTGGGGIYSRSGELAITDSTISGNRVTGAGGGIGGGLYASGNATLRGTAIAGNVADGNGGGVFKAQYTPYGDGVLNTQLHVFNGTLSGNAAGVHGGAVASQRPVNFANSTVAYNHAEQGGGGAAFTPGSSYEHSFDLRSSIVATNTAGAGAALPADLGASGGTLTLSGAASLIGDAGTLALPPGTLDGDPQLQPLADNGGGTATHALSADSPAIDAGDNISQLGFDQRGSGFLRVVGGGPDIGAFEAQAGPPPGDADLATQIVTKRSVVGALDVVTWYITMQNTGPDPATGVELAVQLPPKRLDYVRAEVTRSDPQSSWSCGPSGDMIRCRLGSGALSAARSPVVRIETAVSSPSIRGPVGIVADLKSAMADPDAGNSNATASVTVVAP